MPIFSNIDEVGDFFRRMFDESGFEMSVAEGKNLGEFCADMIVGSIQARAQQQRGVSEEWDDNSPAYAAEKEETYGETRVNYRTGQMLSEESLNGQTTITNKLVTMKYGTGKPPENAKDPHDERPRSTDTAKAGWAHEQGRSFYEIGEEAEHIHIVSGIAFANHAQKRADE